MKEKEYQLLDLNEGLKDLMRYLKQGQNQNSSGNSIKKGTFDH